MSTKDKWVKKKMEDTRAARANSAPDINEQASSGTLAKKWARQKWDERWGHYLDTVPALRNTPAHEPELSTRKKLHQGLRKAESSLAVQLRTEKIRFAAFLYGRRVPACFRRRVSVVGAVKTQSILLCSAKTTLQLATDYTKRRGHSTIRQCWQQRGVYAQ